MMVLRGFLALKQASRSYLADSGPFHSFFDINARNPTCRICEPFLDTHILSLPLFLPTVSPRL
jgi:hypothetical protein